MSNPETQAAGPQLRRILLGVSLGSLATLCALVLRPLLAPIVWAAILAYATWPVYQWLQTHLRRLKTPAALVMTILIASAVVVPVLWLLILMRPMINANFLKLAWAPTTDPALVAYEDQAARRNSLFMMKALLSRCAGLAAADLAGLDLPVLILAGDHDGVTPPAAGEAVAKLLPDVRFETLADCGHQIMLEQPARTNALIGDFIGN